MRGLRSPGAIAVVAAMMFAAALTGLWPRARHAIEVLLAQDDPVALADAQLHGAALDRAAIERQIDQALAGNDAGLAQSFCDLAAAHGVPVTEDVAARVAAAVQEEGSASHVATQFASGLLRGEASDLPSLSGTVTGDLFVFGDVRDVVREAGRLARGEEPDRLVLGLAAAGIAVTAATYVSLGGAAPVRTGLTLVKDARKAGRLGAGLSEWAERSARDIVDVEEMQQAVTSASLLRPGASVEAVRTAFRAGKAGEVLRAVKDVGRIGESAGLHGALDTLRVAEGPKDIARAARLAESKGSQTRAILKLLGRGALLLLAGAFDLSLWLMGAALALLGFLCSIKATAERVGAAWSRRARARRALRVATAQAAPARFRVAAMPGAQLAVPAQIL
ncbi:MAG: hypothetical protein ACLP8B_14330 [Xanthobacteraceae bacterium]